MTDSVDQALQALKAFAATSGSNLDIVREIDTVIALRKTEMTHAEEQAKHAKAMRDEACAVLGITPGALIGRPDAGPYIG